MAFVNWPMPVNSARSCGGRRPSSTWPPVTPPRAPTSAWDHRWRSRWHGAALPGGGWAVPDGAKTSTTPSRWPDAATRKLFAAAVAWTYGFAMQYGVLRADDSTVRVGEEAVQAARQCQQRSCGGLGRVHAGGRAAEPGRRGRPSTAGSKLMVQSRSLWLRERALFLIPVTDLWAARETARRGDRDAAIAVMRQAVDELHQAGRLCYGAWGTGVLVETLLDRGTEDDLAEAHEAIDWLANLVGRSRLGDARDHAAAAARAARPCPRRPYRLPGLSESLPHDGRSASASKDTSHGPRRWSRVGNSRSGY